MDFTSDVQITFKDINPLDELKQKHICPFCNSTELITRSSRIRIVQDMGTTMEKNIARIKEPRVRCQSCKSEFVIHHPFFPPKYEYSKAVVEYALTHYYYMNTSGKDISKALKALHQVDVSKDTIYTWLQRLSPDFLKVKLDTSPCKDLSKIKTISIDGSYISTGKAIIGKKKLVDSLSVTKLANGDYLLMWWE